MRSVKKKREMSAGFKITSAIALAAVLLSVGGSRRAYAAAIGTGTLTADQVNVRADASAAATKVTTLPKGTQMSVEGVKADPAGKYWYQVSFTYNNTNYSGYILGDFVKYSASEQKESSSSKKKSKKKKAAQTEAQLITDGEVTEIRVPEEIANAPEPNEAAQTKTPSVSADTAVILSDEQFEAALQEQGFPEDYKAALRQLHETHPTWVFKATSTGLTWNEALTAESKVGRNLVAKTAITSWKSTDVAAYKWKNNTWYTFDGGSWVAASPELTAYYMDPRNFLDETQIFQFESLEYQDYQTKAGVKAMLAGTFMKGNFTDTDGKKKSYASTFLKVGKKVGVNPYHLAARCYQEQGSGKSDSISGKVAGYENIFNYFNVGAYATGKNSPSRQGLVYAAGSAKGAGNYGRPWNSRYQSILGGSTYLAEKYVKAGQNTLYFQKFNVVNKKNGLYQHQYMTNVQAAGSEAVKMKKAYEKEDAALVFYIPVYKDMPAKKCALPSSNEDVNNYLSSLSVGGQTLSPVFNGGVYSYKVTVKKKVESVIINATAASGKAKVTGAGEVVLERGENTFTITCKSAAGKDRKYTIVITRK